MTALEQYARQAWRDWGYAYAQWTVCRRCKEWRYCRAKRYGYWRCLDCFDQG